MVVVDEGVGPEGLQILPLVVAQWSVTVGFEGPIPQKMTIPASTTVWLDPLVFSILGIRSSVLSKPAMYKSIYPIRHVSLPC